MENETEANRYAAKCLVICSLVCGAAWVLTLLRIFTVPVAIMNTAMPVIILCFWMPSLLCRLTGGSRGWVKYAVLFCSIMGVFILSSAMPKHGVLVWTLPLMLSCHYYSKNLTRITLVVSQILFSCSIYIGMYFGEWDQILLDAAYYSGPRVVTRQNLYDATVFFVLTRAAALWGLSSICTTMAGRTRQLLERQAKDSEERQRIETELDVAHRIQADMLPCIFPAFPERPEFDIYASMAPAREVGGDFYDFFMVDERHLAIVIADVSGKGVPAALFMVIGKTLIKDHTKPGIGLGDVFSQVNDLLCDSNHEGMFITAFEGVLDLVSGEFCFVNAGHEIPFISRDGEPFRPHKIRPGFVLAGMEHMKYQCGSFQLAPGDKIFQYTDGVTEATNREEELYGMARLEDVLEKNTAKSPEALLSAVREDIDTFVGSAQQFDDITMLCVEYKKRMADV
ncbi:MAG: PP2C family protein-serine/threonine phosphatase [Lachnospiraceae bacterium]|nr:PP2C family protein-serine/threonine phosphatase [Lachnospiraceae bacterium]